MIPFFAGQNPLVNQIFTVSIMPITNNIINFSQCKIYEIHVLNKGYTYFVDLNVILSHRLRHKNSLDVQKCVKSHVTHKNKLLSRDDTHHHMVNIVK